MQQGMVSSNSLKQLQQTQSNQLLSLNFDDDNELQNLAGMVDDEDLPDVFWDYEDVGNIPYSDDGHISTQSVAAVLNDKTQKRQVGKLMLILLAMQLLLHRHLPISRVKLNSPIQILVPLDLMMLRA